MDIERNYVTATLCILVGALFRTFHEPAVPSVHTDIRGTTALVKGDSVAEWLAVTPATLKRAAIYTNFAAW